jgi:hypothetical protein
MGVAGARGEELVLLALLLADLLELLGKVLVACLAHAAREDLEAPGGVALQNDGVGIQLGKGAGKKSYGHEISGYRAKGIPPQLHAVGMPPVVPCVFRRTRPPYFARTWCT